MGGKQMSNKRRNQNPLLSTFRWSFTLNIFPFSLSEFWCSDRKSRFNGSSSFFSSRQQVCHWRGNLCSAAPKELLWSKTGYKTVLSSTPGRDRLPRERTMLCDIHCHKATKRSSPVHWAPNKKQCHTLYRRILSYSQGCWLDLCNSWRGEGKHGRLEELLTNEERSVGYNQEACIWVILTQACL